MEMEFSKTITFQLDVEPTPLTSYKRDLDKLIKTLYNYYPNNLPIPCSDVKNPLLRHMNNQYTWETFQKTIFKDNGNIGILLKDLVVIDIDCKEYVEYFEKMFPILADVVSEETKKGKHYFFKRTQLCNEYKINDLARCLKVDNIKLPIDCKTITSTGTAGVIVVAPSADKKWVIPIYEKELTNIPDEITIYLKDNWANKIRERGETKKVESNAEKEARQKENINKLLVGEKNSNSLGDTEYLLGLLDILGENRAEDYSDWMSVGFALYNMSRGDVEFLKYWIHFSKYSHKYKDGVCEEKWLKKMNLNEKGFNLGSLIYWAKLDNKDKFFALQKKSLTNLILSSLSRTDYDIALVAYKTFQSEYVALNTADGKSAIWYHFENHRWKPNGIVSLKKKLSTIIYEEFKKTSNEYIEKAENESDCESKESLYDLAETIANIAKVLKDSKKLNNIISMLATLFAEHPQEFFEKLDSNKKLLGFENGVLDLEKKVFRAGSPDDYITFSCGYDYTTEVDIIIRKELEDYFTSISSSDDMKQYMLNCMCNILPGEKIREIMYLWIGSSRNGKGTNTTLLGKTLGNYYKEVPCDLITDNRNKSGQASSELAQTKGVRAIVFSEPKENQKIQLSTLKQFIGGDKISARPLFKEAIDFDAQFQIIIQTNHEPELSNYEPEFIDKLEMLEYPYRFVRNPQNSSEKPIIEGLKVNFKNNVVYHQQFMLMLVERYFNYGTNYPIPQFIKNRGQEYIDNNNIIGNWLEENFIITKNEGENKIYKKDLWELFKKDVKDLGRNAFYTELEKKNGFRKFTIRGFVYYKGLKPKNETLEANFINVDDI